ncbi:MAG TPA: ABC-2 family transporter protein [Anaerolineales bacterium]|nr:ABC-2 family transporter protein [Anaerolineales bacterium]
MNAVSLYFRLIRVALQSRLQYRADFITGIIGVIILNLVDVALIGILVNRFRHLNGWTLWEMVFLYCLWLLGHSFYSFFFWHIRALEDYLVEGTFDQFLMRPASPFIMFLGREVQYLGVADLTFSTLGLSLAYQNLNLQWSSTHWLFFGAAVISGTLIETTLILMIACISFWTGRSRRAHQLLNRLNMMVQHYPVDIFGYTFRVIVTGLIPVAFMNYYPALMLLGKLDLQSPWGWLGYMSPVVALALVIITSGIWHLAIRRYSSSGG